MTAFRVIVRSLVYFRAAHSALLAGMILVTAVLTGALILGDSVRDSLGDLAARRRGNYESIVTAPGLFSTALAQRSAELSGRSCAAGLVLPGRVRCERSELSGAAQLVAIPNLARLARREAWITHSVAEALQVHLGDALLITLPRAESSPDAVLARRDRASLGSLRVTVNGILDEQPVSLLAWFDLHPSQRPPANIWLNLADLQEALMADVPAAQRIPQSPVNVMLAGSAPDPAIQQRMFLQPTVLPPQAAMTLEDYGLRLSPADDETILHSGTLYLSPPIVAALHRAAAQTQAAPDRASRPLEVYTLLLDRVTTDNARTPPLNYVMATGLSGIFGAELKDDEVAVNQWTADQLSLKVGDRLQVYPYQIQGDAVAAAGASTFKVGRVLPMTGRGADPTLTPTFHGLTDADTIANWNPPPGFPFDRTRVTPADEAYWNDHKVAPKIFFSLLAAQRLAKPEMTVSSTGQSAGELTSVRVPAAEAQNFERGLLKALTPQAAGFVQRPFAPAQAANTDFASLFLGLSGFLLIAALLLVVLLFRLAAEQRARQMGLLAALGFTPRRIARMILAEGILVALLGTLAGLPAAALYTGLLVRGLGTWWIGATGTQAIALHLRGTTLALGGNISLLAAGLALWVSARRIARATAGAQLRGELPSNQPPRHRLPATRRWMLWLVGVAMALLPLLLSGIGILAAPIAFLLSGFLILALAILLLARLPAASRRVRHSLAALAAAGILRQRTRAVLCVGLMAAAAFLLTSVTAFESAPTTPTKPPSPTGGYQLILTTQIPLPASLQTPAGRKLLGVPEDPLFAEVCFTALHVQPGDDISCLNMTRPASATLVGVPAEVLQRLAVARQSAQTKAGAIPAAVDQQTAEYILHASLGDRLPETAVPRPIVIDRLLADSIFQNAALIPDADFRWLYPATARSSLILVDCPPASVPALRTLLRRHLDDFGITVETTTERLASYHAVADSYIAAFQFLGALALLTGTLGLVVVLARNVIQRRAELALLQALGFTRHRVTLLLVLEHGMLLTVGLALGVLTALLATLPQIRQVHISPVASALGVILLAGLTALVIAARLAMQRLTPAALRQE